ncbi:nucleoside diphosphate kinase homolog 5 [Spea bombifrons]|uniref:nucleoside diphosphate kinase homolog 5 n=1 Tax=Spea bombifrons TaxID=233779 RepID=UPI002349D66E|nr:nucleoside diphosphate kinase homolog 5 [Spea bombifrons]XP_053321376.1 nucleoside diphosphate kinase homolog 5 [Spea bombifrons]XP_053321377.1 nucleoside diphosphate kinase homolog 5 [Spea bombifrons]
MNVGKQQKLENSMSGPKIYIERTLALIKPDAFHKEEEIEDLILRSGFYIVQKRKINLIPEQCSDFYSDQYGKMFFPTLTAYMSSGPVVAFMLSRHNAISYWKELIGPSNSLKAKETHPYSLRALYGTDDLRNAVHGSNCFISAEREIRFMFPEAIIEPVPIGQAAKDYLNLFVNPILLSGLTELCKEKPADPYIWLADWLFKYNSNGPYVDRRPLE